MANQLTLENQEDFKVFFKHSIILRTLVAFSLIITFNLLSMLGGMYLAESIRGDAEAINKAGSLRMQSFRLALTINNEPDNKALQEANRKIIDHYISEFQKTIHSPSLLKAIKNNENLDALYTQVFTRWQKLMLPLVEQTPPQKRAFKFEVPIFVETLDNFVEALQLTSEQKLSYIRGLQISVLFITVLLAFFVIISSHNKLVTPLLKLIGHAKSIGKGNFNIKTNINDTNELGLLAKTLDMMGAELSELYANLENKVNTKTKELQQSNLSLELLFDTAKRLYKTTDDPIPVLAELLQPIRHTLSCEHVSLCLFHFPGSTDQKAHSIFSTHQQGKPDYCHHPECTHCPIFQSPDCHSQQLYSFTIMTENVTFGHLHLEMPKHQQLEAWQIQLLTVLTDFFAAALNLNMLGQKQARIALMEERAVIARELHDSLAQALSYQKVQLALLKKQLANHYSPESLQATFTDLQAGLSAAYRQLRELLSTFRLKLDQPGLASGIEATIQEFSHYTPMQIHFDHQIKHCPLTPNEEIHCLQIVREALSNVTKHANAQNCNITLNQDDNGVVHIYIDDDGVGIDLSRNRTGHYGISILKERTESLSGQLQISALTPGTRVHVRFLPQYRYNQPDRETAL